MIGSTTGSVLKPREPVVQVRQLTKRFPNDRVVLRSIDLTLYRSEYVFFLGPTGVGKTSLLRAIFGLDTQIEGEIQFIPTISQSIAFLSQTTTKLVSELTTRENLSFVRPIETDPERWLFLQELLELGPYLDRPFEQLSGGTQQLLELAITVFCAKELVVIDESLTNLSIERAIQIFSGLRRYAQTHHLTMIQTTHDHQIAFHCADRILVLHQGRIIADDTPMEIFLNPATLFLFNFVGRESTEKNNIQGTITGLTSELRFETPGLSLPIEGFRQPDRPIRPGDRVILAFNAGTVTLCGPEEQTDIVATVTKSTFVSEGIQRIRCSDGSHELICLTPRPFRIHHINDRVGIRLNRSHTYLFHDDD